MSQVVYETKLRDISLKVLEAKSLHTILRSLGFIVKNFFGCFKVKLLHSLIRNFKNHFDMDKPLKKSEFCIFPLMEGSERDVPSSRRERVNL